jgi:hypothetical protein
MPNTSNPREPKERIHYFLNRLEELFNEFHYTIDCHCEFVSTLKDPSGNIICTLSEECDPDYNEIEDYCRGAND